MSKYRNHSRFIPSEELGAVSQWNFGSLLPQPLALEQLPAPASEAELALEATEPDEAAQVRLDRAWADGHAAGLNEGLTEATQAGNQKLDDFVQGQGAETARSLAELLAAMHTRLEQVEQDMAQQVLELACALARQVVRRELSVDKAALEPVVREALGMLVADGQPSSVKLHPQDAAVLQPALQAALPAPHITWLADAAVERGGCLVESAGMVIDGTLSRRWERAVANLGLDSTWAAADMPADPVEEEPEELPEPKPAAKSAAKPAVKNKPMAKGGYAR